MIDAVSIKEGEGIPEGGNASTTKETNPQDFAPMKEELTGRINEATRAVKDTLSTAGNQGLEGIKMAVECTRRHQTLTLLVLGLSAGLIVGWILYQRK